MSNPRDEISRFLTGMSDDLVEEFHSSILHYSMNISRLMFHDQQVEESRLRRKNRETKRDKSFESCYSKRRLEI